MIKNIAFNSNEILFRKRYKTTSKITLINGKQKFSKKKKSTFLQGEL